MAGRPGAVPLRAGRPGHDHRSRRGSRRRPEGSNVDHLCLVVEPLDWQEVVDSGVFTVLDGPGERFGARGTAQSLYVRDPDGNTVELRWYPQDA